MNVHFFCLIRQENTHRALHKYTSKDKEDIIYTKGPEVPPVQKLTVTNRVKALVREKITTSHY